MILCNIRSNINSDYKHKEIIIFKIHNNNSTLWHICYVNTIKNHASHHKIRTWKYILSLYESHRKIGCNDRSDENFNMLILNQVHTILYIFCLNNESINIMYKLIPKNKTRIYSTLPQRNAIKFLQDYYTKQFRNNGSFPLN